MASRARVLLVEDDTITLDLLSDALRVAGYHVDGVRSVGAALEVLGRQTYDVVLSDHGLPDIAGLDLLAALLGATPQTPRILCTGAVSDELLEQAREFGVFAVLSKPVRLEMLLVTVAAALGRRGRTGT
jgi:DNA-binding NtrC family response regulator